VTQKKQKKEAWFTPYTITMNQKFNNLVDIPLWSTLGEIL
jgi:hypothetical protein